MTDSADTLAGVPSPITTIADPPLGAVSALIIDDDGRYLLQLRDDKPGIWFPGFWGLFGGAVDDGESPTQALLRELVEELDLHLPAKRLRYFSQIAFDFRPWGQGPKLRYAFVVRLNAKEIANLVLGEGQAMRLFSSEDVLVAPKITPYDGHMLRLHITQQEIVQARTLP